jgi:amidase
VSSLHDLSALELIQARKTGELSARELVDHFLARIDTLNPSVHAVVTITRETAVARAVAMDERQVDPGILWGLPFADKDLSNRVGVRTGAGSKTRNDSPPATETDSLPQALDEAGGISLGKTAVCEFGLSSYTESEVCEPTRNPYAPERGSGGSSGGAAAAVAAGMLPFAPGNDGGGSVRIPAWTCGVVGHKPSRGLIPASTGFDSLGGLVVAGPLARTVADAALVLDAMRGSGVTHRATGPSHQPKSFLHAVANPENSLRIAVTTRSPWDDWADIILAPEATEALSRVAGMCEALGHRVEQWDWQPPPGYPQAFHAIWSGSAMLLDIPRDDRNLLEPLTRHLLEQGERLGARDLAGALLALSRFESEVIAQFSHYDVVITPGLATMPPEIGFYDREDSELNFRQQVQVTPFSSFVNVCGLPALALPVMACSQGLPVGVQLIGGSGRDGRLFGLGASLESELGWIDTKPVLW